ncbi:DUF3108 domain-containing protein [Methylonatrum kenyense]|uniref:DUF3108 domain-containing protein n=1 Tax=Methylonatrum kenyense TaxID=455253 RepID=UPI0020BEF0A3|nr:DUF3108 domain-containing protein [Methylonatrum kenyense]MCK8515476.1 DUF3108 domain-containing protein [Methylonatrum kenyense]
MMSLLRVLLVLSVLLVPGTPLFAESDNGEATVDGLPTFSANYELRRNNLRAAELSRSLRCDDGVCEFRSEGRTVGLADLVLRGRIDEWTRFRLGDNGLIVPVEYHYRQRARGDNDEFRRLFFYPEDERVTSRGDDQWEKTIPGETMDELLSQLRLLLAVRAGETEMTFSVVDDDGEVDEYHFEVVGRETVETGEGELDTIRVDRVGGSSNRRTRMWFAPELEYVPVKVQHERIDRETYTATLTDLIRD